MCGSLGTNPFRGLLYHAYYNHDEENTCFAQKHFYYNSCIELNESSEREGDKIKSSTASICQKPVVTIWPIHKSTRVSLGGNNVSTKDKNNLKI